MAVSIEIDVAKHALEWTAGPEKAIQHVRSEPRPIAGLVRRLAAMGPERIVVESTGGYERRLMAKLAEAGSAVVMGNLRRVRSFGEVSIDPQTSSLPRYENSYVSVTLGQRGRSSWLALRSASAGARR